MSDKDKHYALIDIHHGSQFPYDADDEWWNQPVSDNLIAPPPAVDSAHKAARAIVANLKDRRSIGNGFERIDEEIRAEIISAIANIIRVANHPPSQPCPPR